MRRPRVALVLVLALALWGGCAKKADAPPADEDTAPQLPAAELQRGKDACAAYLTQVCACTAPAAKEACALARALPEAMQVGLEVATSPDSKRRDVLQANDSIRKTIKTCIEETAKLPSLGC